MRNLLKNLWDKRPIIRVGNSKLSSLKTARKEIKPADEPHPDGFVYKVTLEYRLAADNTPFISITDDGNITGAKICSAEDNSYFVAQFGGENISPPLFAHIYFTSVNLQKQDDKLLTASRWDRVAKDLGKIWLEGDQ